MTKSTFLQATTDFGKSNGVDTVFNTEGPSLTRQEFAEECDINSLMKKYDAHVIGGPGNLSPANMFYADFSNMPKTLLEYHEFMDQAQAAFMTLPAVVRKEFDNDATMFVEFAGNPDNLDQMRSWGLAPPAKAPEVPSVVSTAPTGSAPPGAPPAPGGAPTHGST